MKRISGISLLIALTVALGFPGQALAGNWVKAKPQYVNYVEGKSINLKGSWVDFVGSHYRIWPGVPVGILRAYPFKSWGMVLDVTEKKHKGLKSVVGKFSGEKRYYNFERNEEAVKRVRSQGIDVLPIIGTNGDIYAMKVNKGKYFKDCIYEQVKHFNSGEFAQFPLLYWQVGNEVNSAVFFNIDQIDFKKTKFSWSKHFNRPEQIRKYVEYCFAPAVEAIEKASQDVYGDPDKIKVVLGSVGNFYSPSSQEWLEKLLNTKIIGERAPTLKGDKVWEHTDIISLHYLVSMASRGPKFRDWRTPLNSLYKKWILPGKIEGMWATEEYGERGYGMSDIVVISSRWLDWWSRHNWSPEKGKCIFWGDNMVQSIEGFPGVYAEGLIGNFLKNAPLNNYTDKLKIIGKNVEGYVFGTGSKGNSDKLLFIFFSKEFTQRGFSLEKVILEQTCLPEAYVYPCRMNTKEGLIDEKINFIAKKQNIRININKDFAPLDVLLIFVSKEKYDWSCITKKFHHEKGVLSRNAEILSMQPGNAIGFLPGGFDSNMEGDEDVLMCATPLVKSVTKKVKLFNDYQNYKKVKVEIRWSVNRVYPEKIAGELYWDDKHLATLDIDTLKKGNVLTIEANRGDFDFSSGYHKLKLVKKKPYFWVAIDALRFTGM